MKKIILIFLGVFLAFAIAETVLQVSGFVIKKTHNIKQKNHLKNKKDIVILCIGESTTYNQYTVYLQTILNDNSPGRFTVIDMGMPAARLSDINLQLDGWLETYKPDIVLAMTGINDTGNITWKFHQGGRICGWLYNFKTVKLAALLFNKHVPEETIEPDGFNLYIADIPYPQEVQNEFSELSNKYYHKSLMSLAQGWDVGLSIRKYKEFLLKYPEYSKAAVELAFMCMQTGNETEGFNIACEQIEKGNKDPMLLLVRHMYFKWLNRKNPHEGEILRQTVEAAESVVMAENIYLNEKLNALHSIKGIISRERYLELLQSAMAKFTFPPDWPDRLEAINLLEQGDRNAAEKLFTKAAEMKINYESEQTLIIKALYDEILGKIAAFGAKPFFMQYPVRKLKELEVMLESSKYYPQVTFISNEEVFKQHIGSNGYASVFDDQFAADFGHSNATGNMLIAKNAAAKILKFYK
jgi:lysophospholipase L1-like esterase